MTKYSVYQEENNEFSSREFPNKNNITESEIIDAYFDNTANYPELVGKFDTLEEATKAYEKIKVTTVKKQGWTNSLIIADVAYIEEEEWEVDEDGEEFFVCGNSLNAKAAPYVEEEDDEDDEEEEEEEEDE